MSSRVNRRRNGMGTYLQDVGTSEAKLGTVRPIYGSCVHHFYRYCHRSSNLTFPLHYLTCCIYIESLREGQRKYLGTYPLALHSCVTRFL